MKKPIKHPIPFCYGSIKPHTIFNEPSKESFIETYNEIYSSFESSDLSEGEKMIKIEKRMADFVCLDCSTTALSKLLNHAEQEEEESAIKKFFKFIS